MKTGIIFKWESGSLNDTARQELKQKGIETRAGAYPGTVEALINGSFIKVNYGKLNGNQWEIIAEEPGKEREEKQRFIYMDRWGVEELREEAIKIFKKDGTAWRWKYSGQLEADLYNTGELFPVMFKNTDGAQWEILEAGKEE